MKLRNSLVLFLVAFGIGSFPIVAVADFEWVLVGPKFFPVCANEVEGDYDLLVDNIDAYDSAHFVYLELRKEGSLATLDDDGKQVVRYDTDPISATQWGRFNRVQSTFQEWQDYCVETDIDITLLDLFGGAPYEPDVDISDSKCAQAPGGETEEP